MEKSIFEQIIDGNIPSLKVFEDNKYIAILDINPKQKGHTLLIPKKKQENILEDFDSQQDILILASEIADKLKLKLGATGIKLVFNNGATAGQVVFHTHLHIIPYYENEVEAVNNEEVLSQING